MNAIIIYGSCYGASQTYAEALSEQTGIPVQSFREVTTLNQYDTLVYIGGLYAGKVLGLAQTLKRVKAVETLLVVTVGLASPDDPGSMQQIRSKLDRQVPKALLDKMEHIHLRGAIDYEKLSLRHTMMMSFMVSYLKRQPTEKQTPETKDIIDTFGHKVDFMDPDALAPIAARLK